MPPATAASRAWGSPKPASSAPFGSSSMRFRHDKEPGKQPAPPSDLRVESKAVQVGYKERHPPKTTPRSASGCRATAAQGPSAAAPIVIESKENRGFRSCNRPVQCHTVELTLAEDLQGWGEGAPDPACRGGPDCVVPKRTGSASHPRIGRGGGGAMARAGGGGGGGNGSGSGSRPRDGGSGSGVMARASGSGGASWARRGLVLQSSPP